LMVPPVAFVKFYRPLDIPDSEGCLDSTQQHPLSSSEKNL
jgi:hypothetical protein